MCMVEDDLVFNTHTLNDTIRMYDEYRQDLIMPAKIKNLDRLHDDIMRQTRRLKQADYKFPELNKELAAIDSQSIGSLEVVLPKTHYELIEWSEIMNNCINSYASAVKKGDLIVLGVLKNNKMKYNISIGPTFDIQQFYGHSNSGPDKKDKKDVIDYLVKKNIINKPIEMTKLVGGQLW